jgi:M6 family metalloprotease-like protein
MVNPMRTRSLSLLAAALLVACTPRGTPSGTGSGGSGSPGNGFPPVLDRQTIRDQDDMTWGDFRPIPGTDWANPSKRGSQRQMRVAILAADYPDYPFIVTRPKGSDPFGNPRVDPVTRLQVPRFYADFYNTPNATNYGHTIHEYWMEQSRGRIGVEVTSFGPYRLSGHYYQYGGFSAADTPGGVGSANGAGQLDSMWRADKGDSIGRSFDLVVRMYAGYDETATWQEFGEMKFQTRDDIPKEWGNPDTTKPRWVRSRYVPWTSWLAGVWLWSNAGGGRITQGESINSIRHEIAHAAFSIGDNYNNPYATPYRRTHAGPWDLMDRGSFNGPGGPHTRYVTPPNQGGSMSAGLMLRQRLYFKFIDSASVLFLNRNGLARTGIAVTDITARVVDPIAGTVGGIQIRLDGPAPQDRSPLLDPATNPTSSGTPNFNTYTVEVAQRMGADSYLPDNGVLIGKNKDNPSSAGGPNAATVFTWTIDANPADINTLDFKRPNGEPVMRTPGDYRQLNDALFHAGLNSGSTYEWEDTANRLRFYVVDVRRDARGILVYTVAVRSLDGAGPHRRGVSLTAPATAPSGDRRQLAFTLANTGAAVALPAGAHIRDVTPMSQSDVYRLSVSVEGAGWTARLQNALSAVPFGANKPVPVFVEASGNASATAIVRLTATSESDPTKTSTAIYTVAK